MEQPKKKFASILQLLGIVLVFGVTISITLIDIVGSYRDFRQNSQHSRQEYINEQKKRVQQEVKWVGELIKHKKSQNEELVKKQIQMRVYEAYSIAENIYQQLKGDAEEEKIEELIFDALRPIRFLGESGYYFATRLDGTELLFADRPEMEGVNMLDTRDTRGKYVIRDMISLVSKAGEGFYEYHWTKPESQGATFKKISFVKYFPPLDCFIGTGLYVDDMENQIQGELLDSISQVRFGEEGYIFVNHFNGDALLANGRVVPGKKKLWEIFNKNPEAARALFANEYAAAMKPGGDYISYRLRKLHSPDVESQKVSFIYGIPELQWLIGAGFYEDDVEKEIRARQAALTREIQAKVVYFFLNSLLILGIFLFILNRLNRRLMFDVSLLISFFKKAAFSNEAIDRGLIHYDELDRMAENVNKMLEDKIQAEQEREQLAEKLNVANKMKSIGLMAGGVAHDLNNILAGIVAYPELLLQKLPQESELRKPIQAIHESGTRAAEVVADLLTIARGAASSKDIYNLNQLVQEYFDSPEWANLTMRYPEITWEYSLSADAPLIFCSSVHVKKCLMNLVINAAEALGQHGNIVVQTEKTDLHGTAARLLKLPAGKYAVLKVIDNGPGIKPEDKEHIFEPFYTKKVMGQSGSGLGLTVVWNTMEDHNGGIEVDSTENGTRFQLYFQLVDEDNEPKAEAVKATDYFGNGEHILVVDDEPQLRDIAEQILRRLGYMVESVDSGEAAIAHVQENQVDLIVLDMIMEPGLNGRETFQKIISLYPGQKAIITSGFSESEDVKVVRSLGAGQFVKKPYTVETLGRAVRETLQS
ncbi:cache domain-containing protein [Desulfogranum japonicum]|uniref:cache domain-containing protein n=1 Tax=Desulfogranum japonicum TaxID=231447 RepID=UPI0003F4F291|nr:cache domain-containing protein [Desulfogranum japonicum]